MTTNGLAATAAAKSEPESPAAEPHDGAVSAAATANAPPPGDAGGDGPPPPLVLTHEQRRLRAAAERSARRVRREASRRSKRDRRERALAARGWTEREGGERRRQTWEEGMKRRRDRCGDGGGDGGRRGDNSDGGRRSETGSAGAPTIVGDDLGEGCGGNALAPSRELSEGCAEERNTNYRRAARSSPVVSRPPHTLPTLLSVILPAYNAMPWLPLAVRDSLKQELDGDTDDDRKGGAVEVLVADDCSTDGSLSFLVELVALLGEERGSIERVVPLMNDVDGHERDSGSSSMSSTVRLSLEEARALAARRTSSAARTAVTSTNPALVCPERGAELSRGVSDIIPDAEASIANRPLTPAEVAYAAGPRNALRVLVTLEDINVGQGGAMTRCLRASSASSRYIGHMESDDERPHPRAYPAMLSSLRSHPEWDGVTCETRCVGWKSRGMARYVEWQNGLDTPDKMRGARFVEIPSLMQAGVFRREAVLRALMTDHGDDQHGDVVCDGNDNGNMDPPAYRDDPMWAVDTHFWLSFYHRGLVAGRVSAREDDDDDEEEEKALFHWRQHPGQQTRSHGRLSIENLRRCKCVFLLKEGGYVFPRRRGNNNRYGVEVQVWSTGGTLGGWVYDLKSELAAARRQSRSNEAAAVVVAVDWKPGRDVPARWSAAMPRQRRATGDRAVFRLFAFGMEKARRQIREQLGSDWKDECDIFVS